jgi:hypothetical protein
MKPEKQNLIDDLVQNAERREVALHAATVALRRRRQRHIACQVLALLLIPAAAILLVAQNRAQPNLAQVSKPKGQPAAALPQGQSLTDEQLLGLFPNTPVGLATLPNGRKLLVFPRPADDARYVIRL